MKIKRFVFPALVTILTTGIFLLTFHRVYYHPITVSLEISADTASLVQVFYSRDGNFTEDAMVRQTYTDARSFRELSFVLPAGNYGKLRIDPISGRG